MRSRPFRRVRLIASLAAASLLLAALPAFASDHSPASVDSAAFDVAGMQPGQLFVTTEGSGDTAWAAGASVDDASVTQIARRVQLVDVPAGEEVAVAETVAAQAGVLAVEPVVHALPTLVPDDPLYDEQWYHQQTNIEAGWDVTTGGGDSTVVIVDSGINSDHPDLTNRVGDQLKAQDGEIEDGVDGDNDESGQGHGTWVAGAFGAEGDNGIGIAGVDWAADIVDIDIGVGDLLSGPGIIAGIDYAAEISADVLNLSLGSLEPGPCPEALQAPIDDAVAAGVTVVASSGNEQQTHPDQSFWPANCDGTISVAATGPDDAIAPYSSQNEHVDIAAPGGDVTVEGGGFLTTNNPESRPLPDEDYALVQGTSFAAPYISGVISLMLDVDPGLSNDEIYDVLTSTARHPDGVDRDNAYGHGIVDVAAALEAVVPEPRDERRIYGADIESTDVIGQAIAASQDRFGDGEAEWAVVTRDNEYADALSGSTLTAGVAPVLYTGSEGGLSDDSAAELQRVLAEGGLVAVLGGMDAVPAEVDEDLEALGFEAQRIFGPSRGETAEEVAYFLHEMEEVDGVVLAKAFDWPDAVTAGSIGVQYGYPVLLTGYGEDQVDELHPSAARALEEIDPDVLITVGGTSAIGEDAEREAADIGDVPEENIIRLGGGSRLETAIEVGEFIVDNADEDQSLTAFGANVRNPNGWAHILSTSANLLGTDTAPDGDASGGFYVPFEGDDGSRYTDDDTEFVRDWVRTLDDNGLIVGGRDVITDDAADAFFDDLAADDDDDDDDDGDDDE